MVSRDTNQFKKNPLKICRLSFGVLTYILEVHRNIRTSFKYFKHQSDTVRVVLRKKVTFIAV